MADRVETDKDVLWRKVPEKMFREVRETFYLSTPYLKATRLDFGYSLREMAEKAGIALDFYHKFERGQVKARQEYIDKITAVFNRMNSDE